MINNQKQKLRNYALEYRKSLQKRGVSGINSSMIVSKIITSNDFINAKDIALYMPTRGEVDLTNILKISNKNYYLPRCIGDDLEFAKYEPNSFALSKFGIKEPTGVAINPMILDIIYIPCLMANKKCYRLGYGRGYYDRFFKNNKIKAKKIIVVHNDLISDDFVQDELDYKCDSIISEK